MIVRCSACTTRYRIDPTALGMAGRKLRCTRCGHVWLELPSAGAVAAPRPSDETAPPALSPRRSAWGGWLAAGLVVAIVLAGLALARNPIVDTWPDTVRAYDAVGLWIALPRADGLRVVDVESERVRDGDRTVLLVRGLVENAAGERRTLPALRVVLADDSGTELQRWRVAALLQVLPAGETTTFEGWLANPPAGAARLSVDFVAADGE